MDILKFKDLILKKAEEKGFEESEIYYQSGKSFSVSVYKGKIEKYQNNTMSGVSFRGLFNGKMGYAFSEKTDETIIEMLLESAKQNAEIIDSNDKEFIFEGEGQYPDVNVYNEKINDVTTEEKIKMALKMEKAVLGFDKKITACNHCMVANGETEVLIANTKGLMLSEKSNHIIAYASATAEENGQKKVAGEAFAGNDFEAFNPENVGKLAAEKALSYLGSESLKSGKQNVIFKNEAFTDLLASFVGNFYAENVQKGFSLLKGKTGEKIASDLFTLEDMPLAKNGLATCAFDSEGVASYNKKIIENGILKTFLYNLKSAEVDGVKSTGNGFKGSFKASVSTSATNLYVKASNKSFDELIEEMENGIVITELAGLHSGTNSISGDFSLACDGFYVENGKITKPVEQITVAGNFYDVIKSIEAVSDDMFFALPSSAGALASPSVFVGEMDISGM